MSPADPTSIERIREATFPSERRGYSKREVDKFLAKLADWLESGDAGSTKEALSKVGYETGRILTAAEEVAEEIRAEAKAKRGEADAYAADVRSQADKQAAARVDAAEAEAEKIRAEASRDAEQRALESEREANETLSGAEAKAGEIVREAEGRRESVEKEIKSLARRRDAILSELDELAGQLSGFGHQPEADLVSANGRSGEQPSA